MYSANWIYIKYQFQRGLFKKKKSYGRGLEKEDS